MQAIEAGSLRVAPSSGASARAATPEAELDHMLDRLRERARDFARGAVREKVSWLVQVSDLLMKFSTEMAEQICRAQGVDPTSTLSGEAWLTGPVITMRQIRCFIESLRSIQQNGVPRIERRKIADRPEGGVRVEVTPSNGFDKILFPGVVCETWLTEPVTRDRLPEFQARFYQQRDPEGRVVLVLGAGNIAAIPAKDVLTKMFVDGAVCLLKMNPVNEYLGPLYERIFAPLVERGFLAIAYGGADVGSYLCNHKNVDELHMTGSDKTHDLIVWGPPGPEREERKRRNDPLLKKKVTSELGNISPVIVVPGVYSDDELDFTARNIAGMVTMNASYNCNAAKLLVMPAGWKQRERLLERLALVFAKTAARKAYYPGSFDRYRQLTEGRERVLRYGETGEGTLPWTILPGLDASDPNERSFRFEPFCSILAETSLAAADPLEFLNAATRFANERVWGTLNATLMVHPRQEADPVIRGAVEQAVSDLRYGSVVLNYWAAGVWGFAVPPWGGHPSSTLQDVQSGIGFVHNTPMFEKIEKMVLRSPLKVFPKHVWFPDHRTLNQLMPKLLRLEHDPRVRHLPTLAYSAARA